MQHENRADLIPDLLRTCHAGEEAVVIHGPAVPAGAVVAEARGIAQKLAVCVGVDGATMAPRLVIGEDSVRESDGRSAARMDHAPWRTAEHAPF